MHPRKISLAWGIFFINDGSKIDVKMSQITMCYVVCYKRNPINLQFQTNKLEVEDRSCFIFQK